MEKISWWNAVVSLHPLHPSIPDEMMPRNGITWDSPSRRPTYLNPMSVGVHQFDIRHSTLDSRWKIFFFPLILFSNKLVSSSINPFFHLHVVCVHVLSNFRCHGIFAAIIISWHRLPQWHGVHRVVRNRSFDVTNDVTYVYSILKCYYCYHHTIIIIRHKHIKISSHLYFAFGFSLHEILFVEIFIFLHFPTFSTVMWLQLVPLWSSSSASACAVNRIGLSESKVQVLRKSSDVTHKSF